MIQSSTPHRSLCHQIYFYLLRPTLNFFVTCLQVIQNYILSIIYAL